MTQRADEDQLLTPLQAFLTAYRFLWQLNEREHPPSEAIENRLSWMRLEDDHYMTSDPAQWDDWRRCVDDTLAGIPMPDLGSGE